MAAGPSTLDGGPPADASLIEDADERETPLAR
jgi:hypothetical protein